MRLDTSSPSANDENTDDDSSSLAEFKSSNLFLCYNIVIWFVDLDSFKKSYLMILHPAHQKVRIIGEVSGEVIIKKYVFYLEPT